MLRPITQDVVEAKSLIHMHKKPAKNFAVSVLSISGQHGFRDAFVQVLSDLVDWEERNHSLEGFRRENHLRLMHCGFRG
ncbi:hypothetical protein D3C81_2034010 [compost metagenome]